MPRIMRRLWSAGLRALLAAGSLGLVLAAVAQPPTHVPRTAAAPLADPQARVQEIRCELAWLGHAATCPWPLRAQVRGNAMTVAGVVPSEAARQKAMELARGCTPHVVRDMVKVNPALQAPKSNASLDQMLAAVMESLHEVIGNRTEAIEVSSREDGQITLRGTIHSFEEKLAVGQRVRQVPGCTCVANHLTVSTVMKEGKKYHYVSADGLRLVPSDDKTEPATVTASKPADGKTVAAQPAKPSPQGGATINPVMHEAILLPQPNLESPARVIADAVKNTPAPVAATPPASASPYAVKTPPMMAPVASPYSPVKNPVAAKPVTALPAAVSKSASTMPAPRTVGVVPPTMPANWMNEKKPVATTMKVEPIAKTVRPIPEKPYVAMGYVIFEDDLDEVAPTVIRTSASTPVNAPSLRQRILALCPGKVMDVKVVSRPDRTTEVTIVVPASAQDEVSTKVFQLPEIGSPSVKLNIEVHH